MYDFTPFSVRRTPNPGMTPSQTMGLPFFGGFRLSTSRWVSPFMATTLSVMAPLWHQKVTFDGN
jgi:hypothetical protein